MEGQILAERYRLVRQLGQGGMGSVWEAEHLTLRSAVAVKLLSEAIAASPEAVERFEREARAAAALRSAHVVQVLDFGVDSNTPYLVMELLQGEDLSARLATRGRLTVQEVVTIFQQVGRAVARAHDSGIIHRDLKPENIFLVNEGDHEVVKVLDFGIAKAKDPSFASSVTRTGVTMGTPCYMSPEQTEGKKGLDHRTDIWSLGVIACECLTGVRPFDGDTYGELVLNICTRRAPAPSSLGPVPPHFDAWFAKATHREPSGRFGTVGELVSTLAEVGAGRAPFGIPAVAPQTAPTGTDATVLGAPAGQPMQGSGELPPPPVPYTGSGSGPQPPPPAPYAGGASGELPPVPYTGSGSGAQPPPLAGAGTPVTDAAGTPRAMAGSGATTRPEASITVSPLPVPAASPTKWLLPLFGVAVVVALGLVGGWLLWGRGDARSATSQSTSSLTDSAPPEESDPQTLADPPNDSQDTAREALPPKDASPIKPTTKGELLPLSKEGLGDSPKEAPSQEGPTPPNPQPSSTSHSAPPKAPPNPTVRCKSDPFTGALRPDPSGKVPCTRDPFTGSYKRK